MMPPTEKFSADHVLSGVLSVRIVGLRSVREGFFRRWVTYIDADEFFTGDVGFYLVVEVDAPRTRTNAGYACYDIITQDGETYWSVRAGKSPKGCRRKWSGCVISTPNKQFIIPDKNHEIKQALKRFGAMPTEDWQCGVDRFSPPGFYTMWR